jgi:hypothetical protein
MRVIKTGVAVLAIIIPSLLKANDIVVSSASLNGQNVTAGANNALNFTLVRFNMAWSNSWRVSTGPTNWDAAWVFVKYRVEGGTGCTPGGWQHATLSATNSNHSITTDNGTPGSFSTTPDGKGVYIYRAGNGTGAINWQQILLRWNYGADGILDACNVSVKVFAVESVYIPQASFFAGDGASNNGQLHAGLTAAPYQVTSEGAITLGGGGVGSVGNSARSGETAPLDDWDNVISTTLPAAFPKGFQAFYVMKYEISQEQYMEFLNTLTAPQQLQRHGANAANRFWNNAGTPGARNGVKCVILPVGATSGTYACDLNANGVLNEAGDGQNIAMHGISSQDQLAYLDWAALRPLTELELEKSARGTLPAVLNEYAWGSTNIYGTTYAALINPGTGSELPNAPSATLGNAVYGTTAAGIGGATRVGMFATATSSRVTAGAGYYGVMDLSGNVWEVVVGIGLVTGRSFTGVHGNGVLTTTGFADVDFWPGSNGNNTSTTPNTAPNTGSTGHAGLMFRGGSFSDNNWLRISDRQYPQWTGLNTRDQRMGGRGVRTAP